MPSSIVSGILEVLAEFLLEVVCHYFGRIVVPVISLGRWRCDSFGQNGPRRALRNAGVYYRCDDRLRFTAEGTTFVGLVTLVVLVAGGLLVWACLR